MIFDSDIVFLVAAVIFIILVIVIYRVLDENTIFRGPAAASLAVCSALLCMIGLGRFRDIELEVILLPYASLAVTLLLVLLVLAVLRFRARIRTRRKERQTRREMRR